MSPNRISNAIKPIILGLVLIFSINLLYGIFTAESLEDDDTVTFTFNCTTVLNNQNKYPDYVIEECKRIRNQ